MRASSARRSSSVRGDQVEHALALPHPVHRHVDVVAASRRVQPSGDVLAARFDDQSIDVEEEILVGAVVDDLPHLVLAHAVERHANGMRVGA